MGDNTGKEGVGVALHGLFRWLLGELCRKAGIDSQEIDSSLTYDENLAELRRKFPGADLGLPRDWSRKRNERRALGKKRL